MVAIRKSNSLCFNIGVILGKRVIWMLYSIRIPCIGALGTAHRVTLYYDSRITHSNCHYICVKSLCSVVNSVTVGTAKQPNFPAVCRNSMEIDTTIKGPKACDSCRPSRLPQGL